VNETVSGLIRPRAGDYSSPDPSVGSSAASSLESRLRLMAWILGYPVLEEGSIDFVLDLSVAENAFQGDELALLESLDDVGTIREWLKHVPGRLFSAESSRRNSKRRRSHRGGRPKANRYCPTCGAEMGVRDSRKHASACKKGASPVLFGLAHA
jgi:hypothetical protein